MPLIILQAYSRQIARRLSSLFRTRDMKSWVVESMSFTSLTASLLAMHCSQARMCGFVGANTGGSARMPSQPFPFHILALDRDFIDHLAKLIDLAYGEGQYLAHSWSLFEKQRKINQLVSDC